MGTAVCLQGRQPDVAPEDLDASSVVNLQGDASLRGADLRVGDVHHLLAVEPRLHAVALDLQPQRVPIPLLENRLLLVGNLHQPSAAVG